MFRYIHREQLCITGYCKRSPFLQFTTSAHCTAVERGPHTALRAEISTAAVASYLARKFRRMPSALRFCAVSSLLNGVQQPGVLNVASHTHGTNLPLVELMCEYPTAAADPPHQRQKDEKMEN